jgi:hypothetical protein
VAELTHKEGLAADPFAIAPLTSCAVKLKVGPVANELIRLVEKTKRKRRDENKIALLILNYPYKGSLFTSIIPMWWR